MVEHRRCGYVALIGAPNAGKSTLLNALSGSDIAIVTPKPQTTRARLRGIVNHGQSQIIFIDTPGIFDAKPVFEKAMVASAWIGVGEADVVLLLVDAHRKADDDTRRIIEALKTHGKAVILVLNKVDKVQKEALLILSQELYALFDFERSFMISASKGNGVADITRYLAEKMPPGEWLYPEDEVTDVSERHLAAEITRETCFLALHAELPYSLAVETEKWEEHTHDGKREVRIHQTIMVERESQKKIVLGKSGAMLKHIGSAARGKIGGLLQAQVHLLLFVKVSETWKSDPAMVATMGLEAKK